jgi:hypothetical protein
MDGHDVTASKGGRMTIDWATLMAAAPGILAAKADYDFARDGGAVGIHGVNSELVPADSIIVGVAILTTTGLTFSGTGYLRLVLGADYVYTADPTQGHIVATWFNASAAMITAAARAIAAEVTVNACTAGACKFWLFYLPL